MKKSTKTTKYEHMESVITKGKESLPRVTWQDGESIWFELVAFNSPDFQK